MNPSVSLDAKAKRYAGNLATVSSCCGVTGETVLADSAVIMIFAAALGASDMLSLISTSMLPFFNGLFILPGAFLAVKAGQRRMLLTACGAGTGAYLLACCAPFFGKYAVAALLGSILLFTLCTPGFIACWNPLLDSFLTAEERVPYLGKMRFLHQASAITFLFLTGLLIGKDPSVPQLQIVLLLGAVVFSGRLFAIMLIPTFHNNKQNNTPTWKNSLRSVLTDKDLTLFGIYQFILNLMLYATIPVAILYMKNHLRLSGNMVILISNAGLVGMLCGYLLANRLKSKISMRQAFIGLHIIAIGFNFALCFIRSTALIEMCIFAILLWGIGAVIAASSVYCSAETMNLAAPDHKVVTMAWSCAFFYCGCGCSRLFSSFLLHSETFNSGILWQNISTAFSPYSMLFFLYGFLLLPLLILLFKIPAVKNKVIG